MKLARLPFLLLAAACLVSGVGAGLARLGLTLPAPLSTLSAQHGALMVSGFFGALIALERAVAHGRAWAYAAPLGSGAAGLLVLVGQAGPAAWVASAGALAFTLVSFDLARRHLADFTLGLGVAASCLLSSNLAWALGLSSAAISRGFIAFLALTIFAERRELGRVLAPGPRAGQAFAAVFALCLAGAALDRRLLALGLLGMAAWLAVFDVARYTVKKRGLTRFMAVALLSGYAWLAVGAAGMLLAGSDTAGARYDAFVHALMLGFVFSMVFAHAPVIFPAVLGTPLEYSPLFYLHLALLALSLAARLAGDYAGSAPLRQLGGAGNALAIVLFFGVTLRAGLVSPRRKSRR